ncbi:hypothetical protein DYB30_014158 [Aphanomyces astaci]|uniref:Uncharacterized protein n=1 Tax=Aphanomyces astaci TaxID=112090 RepID=A0A397CC13_APHAT|nr:hypothetical protein DYB30_014158 [Aphanomyces astaci]
MKTAVVLSIVAVAAASEHKIHASVLESLQQSPTVNVFVLINSLHNPSILNDDIKCSSSFSELFDCKDLTKNELLSIAALPEVNEILPGSDNSAPDTPSITPKSTTPAAPTHSARNQQRHSSDDRD